MSARKAKKPERARGGEVIIPIPAAATIYTAQEAFGLPPKTYRMCWLEVVNDEEWDEGDYQLGDDLDLSGTNEEWERLARQYAKQQSRKKPELFR